MSAHLKHGPVWGKVSRQQSFPFQVSRQQTFQFQVRNKAEGVNTWKLLYRGEAVAARVGSTAKRPRFSCGPYPREQRPAGYKVAVTSPLRKNFINWELGRENLG